ncbi:hypothetical protein SAMN02745181_1469 [Rubritalea squalenifaciens DSM 18772]|uniref:Uncharacterized protein n=1 Tax=Rubritalea squalenifaciens DSM 18772 TaxID=1123071 RepID=A0A1M6HGK6_9BACT|nr:hypothetical protein SAMN02745181_1469 [Rubritalea squalenifaciens DSM 18772]
MHWLKNEKNIHTTVQRLRLLWCTETMPKYPAMPASTAAMINAMFTSVTREPCTRQTHNQDQIAMILDSIGQLFCLALPGHRRPRQKRHATYYLTPTCFLRAFSQNTLFYQGYA